MLFTLFGIILLLSPLLLIYRFKNPVKGFFTLIVIIAFIQLITALLSQFFHIFNYNNILAANIAACLLVLWLFFRNKPSFKILKKIDLVALYVFFISLIALSLVHYHNLGTYDTIGKYFERSGEPLNYPYPFYSDEWYAVAFIKDSINSQTLPSRNPFWHTHFINLELPFHSFLSGLMLLLNLDPLTGYVKVSIFINSFLVVLVYFILTLNKISRFSSGTAALSALYIANASVLPGLWTLIPLNLGLIFLLLTMIFYTLENNLMLLLSSFLTLIFYPPLVIFIFVLFLARFLKSPDFKSKIRVLSFYSLIVVLSAALISSIFFLRNGDENFINYILYKIYHPTFETNFIANFSIFNVLPIPVLILASLGLFKFYKQRRSLFYMLVLSLVFWIVYSQTINYFIIDFGRVVITSSLLLVIASGFGMKQVLDWIHSKFKKPKLIFYIELALLFLYIPLLFTYTQQDAWQNFTLKEINTGVLNYSVPLPNKYLHPDDLKIFSDIHGKRLLTLPWKATVLAVATDNISMSIKSGTISANPELYNRLMEASCQEKTNLIRQWKIDYIYAPDFGCDDFVKLAKSSEGLYLYRLEANN